MSSSSAVGEVRSPQRHQDHGEWKESQVGRGVTFSEENRKSSEAAEPHCILLFVLTHRKNWTSSWTVLQGSSLLFAKGQGGSTSWVRIPSAPTQAPGLRLLSSSSQHFIHLCVVSLFLISVKSPVLSMFSSPPFCSALLSSPPFSFPLLSYSFFFSSLLYSPLLSSSLLSSTLLLLLIKLYSPSPLFSSPLSHLFLSSPLFFFSLFLHSA